ncbi:MAG: TlyA family rRNA (cytidine-2'-O)-methyltransferase [Solirubrobacterales bacterium]|nr:TlyA family rRNA (cytidine-2'-O)-methyltransferase [Solirubrobacterales bacterium]
MPKRRIDTVLAERGLAGSRTTAAASVRAGRVRIGRDGPLASKPGQLVAADAELLVSDPPRFVSRGGIKLENALERLAIDARGLDCLDVGASTGGFTDCLLKRGAERVIALDVAHGQLDWGLRNDPRVVVIERRNARELEPWDLPWEPRLTTVDVSFISLAKVLPALASCVVPGGEMLAMVKPQFELDRARVGKGGVVRDAADRREALRSVARAAVDTGLTVRGLASSGLPGPKGNRETFIHLARGGATTNAAAPGREAEEGAGSYLEDAIAEVEP